MKQIILLLAFLILSLPAWAQTSIVVKGVDVTGYSFPNGTVQLTVSSDRPIKWNNKTTTAKGVIATIRCSANNGKIAIPDVTLLTTYNAFDDYSKEARFSASLGGRAFKGFESFALRIVNTQTTWVEIADDNVRLNTQPDVRSQTVIDPLTISKRKTERINSNVLVLGNDAATDSNHFAIYAGSAPNAPAIRYNGATQQYETLVNGRASTFGASATGRTGSTYYASTFGASPSATATVNTTAIKNALSAAETDGGGIVEVNDGVYLVNQELQVPSNTILRGNATLKVADNSNFQNVIYATNKSNVIVQGITVDANGANRRSNPNATIGINLNYCIGCTIRDVRVTGTLGSASSPGVGIALSGVSKGCLIDGARVYDVGNLAKASDGIYTSSSETLIVNSIVNNATDTAFVIESASNAGIANCVSINTPAGAAITNFLATDVSGNFINGLTVKNWNAVVSGGIAIGTVGSNAGDLTDCFISNIVLTANQPTYGNGLGVRINNGSSNTGAKVKRVTIHNPNIYDATTQGIAVVATGAGGGVEDVKIEGGVIQTLATGSSAITVQNGSFAEIVGTTIKGQLFGLNTTDTAKAEIRNCKFPSYSAYAAYAYGTSTITAVFNMIEATGIGQFGKDAGATLGESFNLRPNGVDFAGAGNVKHNDVTVSGVLKLNDGTIKTVQVGSADSCGTGFKCLRVVN